MFKRASPIVAIITAIMFFLSVPMIVWGAEDDTPPDWIVEMAEEIGNANGVCPEVLMAMAFEESRFNPDVVSKNGKYIGLLQINPRWQGERMERLGVTDLKDARSNMMVAADYLKRLFDDYEDTGTVIMLYAGYSKSSIASYEQTGKLASYVKRVLERAERYERANGK